MNAKNNCLYKVENVAFGKLHFFSLVIHFRAIRTGYKCRVQTEKSIKLTNNILTFMTVYYKIMSSSDSGATEKRDGISHKVSGR